ncbi:MAG TPA: NAD-dependent epimerase/dehydratase family protein [Gammaproteobacteria bacterium]|nr:NAD-dependent epimerase/dehydratase family protein [Gammaproteobacteria bacterium]
MNNNKNKTILVTGADGFIGRHLCRTLSENHYTLKVATHHLHPQLSIPNTPFVVGDIDETTDWQEALQGVDTIIHLAGIAHKNAKKERGTSPVNPYFQTNVLGTENLAKQAIAAGVTNLIFISSIKVNGEKTEDLPFTAQDPANPQDDYGRSKLAAEKALWKISQNSKLQVVIVRPPLVYGEGVKGNVARLEKLINLHLPLPFKNIHNARSLIHVDNLCKFLQFCVKSQEVAGKTYLIAEEKDFSTPEFLEHLAKMHNQRIKLFACPKIVLWFLFALLGKKEEYKRFTGSLQVAGTLNSLGMRSDPAILFPF